MLRGLRDRSGGPHLGARLLALLLAALLAAPLTLLLWAAVSRLVGWVLGPAL